MFGLRGTGKLDQRLESRLCALQREAMGVHPVKAAPQPQLTASLQPVGHVPTSPAKSALARFLKRG